MSKVFNVTAACMPEQNYMVDIAGRLQEIKALVDTGSYFTINKARQYGKTTTLLALEQYLKADYDVVFLDFQMLGAGEFENENIFALSFGRFFLRVFRRNNASLSDGVKTLYDEMYRIVNEEPTNFRLQRLFEYLSDICGASPRPIVLMIDEVDSVSNNQIFLDFLAQLRAYYIRRASQPAFWSVILAGVYDVKNLKQKFRREDEHKMNSPWNIAADFDIDMSLSKKGIQGMLREYEADHQTGMNEEEMAGLIYDYTSGYPYLVSRLCKLIDENVSKIPQFDSKKAAWTRDGFHQAVRMILAEKNTLFESLNRKLADYPELDEMLQDLLFTGKSIAYDPDNPAMDAAFMFGFICCRNGNAVLSNRIFETRLYNRYLSTAEIQGQKLYKASLKDRNQFLVGGRLNMRRILEKFVEHFDDLYHDRDEAFLEDVGRKYFLLYLRPIINGTGNYYIESQTRSMGRTDLIVDYRGEQFVIEMKVWHGNEYNLRGERQLAGYLDDYHIDQGYMVSFNFNKKKKTGVFEVVVGDKILIEAVV
ncbi:9-O-acetyl-N-acetylneuraminate esterase [Schaedlerella arabinosiphila]|uniref:9-O-acetyl-N-acetylneuraminate esterase n=1 Tax=Schaedlerella arabinosiphila TaxID=2044587 RepID=A0A3R8JS84_9FIRM|nr:AAA-like domain-containing protein [Schaedlerella arabinosiphila]RRK33886.1 9-O-acetyl-N-acetylneuraminate esterase [Schaedlerella arabinosiphila]